MNYRLQIIAIIVKMLFYCTLFELCFIFSIWKSDFISNVAKNNINF